MIRTKLVSAREDDKQGLDYLVNKIIETSGLDVIDVKFTSVIRPHNEAYGWDGAVQHSALIVFKTID